MWQAGSPAPAFFSREQRSGRRNPFLRFVTSAAAGARVFFGLRISFGPSEGEFRISAPAGSRAAPLFHAPAVMRIFGRGKTGGGDRDKKNNPEGGRNDHPPG